MRVLVVEDDAALAAVIAASLRDRAMAVDVAADGENALVLTAINPYDAIILDVMLPKRSGLDVCRALRARGIETPVLMLTGRDAVPDRVAGLDAGADDYLVKPFAHDELLARVRALMRRLPALADDVLTVGDLVIDTRTQQVRRGARVVPLTTREYTLLAYLARRAGDVVSRADITAHVWDDNHDPASNALEVYINRVRRKLEADGEPPMLHTRRGAGYRLAAEP
jgi:two-component system copper resistance phosphate regulon response regulator CusR